MKTLKAKIIAIPIFILLMSFGSSGFSQEISVEKGFLGYNFKKGEQNLNWSELLQETESLPESYDLIKRAKSKKTLSTIFGLAGGALVGVTVGQTIGSADPDWVLAIVGGALLTVAIPLTSRTKSNLKEGISKYNQSLNISHNEHFHSQLHFITNAQGIGF